MGGSPKKVKGQRAGVKVLVLGAGYVSGPLVEYLDRNKCNITVVSVIQAELDATIKLCPAVDTVLMNVSVPEELDKAMQGHDLVISLLPNNFHPEVARLCIKNKKNMVTAYYITPDMRDLHQQAVDAGITILNELGVDPGIDHMLAMECFDEVKEAGGKILSFVSYCGGIPVPENSDVPLRYKFSWFPKAVLMNCLSGAKYLKNGRIIELEGNGRLLDETEILNFLPGSDLEGIPNRDSTRYLHQYDIESARTILRGTIRYKKEYICRKFDKMVDTPKESLKDLVFDKLGKDNAKFQPVLGLLDDVLIDKKKTPIDTLSNYLAKKLSYGPDERDMILMRHEIDIQWENGKKEQQRIDFVQYGDPQGFSAMAKTVGFPVGIGSKMILDGEIQTKGVIAPLTKEIYQPILQRLKEEGITATKAFV